MTTVLRGGAGLAPSSLCGHTWQLHQQRREHDIEPSVERLHIFRREFGLEDRVDVVLGVLPQVVELLMCLAQIRVSRRINCRAIALIQLYSDKYVLVWREKKVILRCREFWRNCGTWSGVQCRLPTFLSTFVDRRGQGPGEGDE